MEWNGMDKWNGWNGMEGTKNGWKESALEPDAINDNNPIHREPPYVGTGMHDLEI